MSQLMVCACEVLPCSRRWSLRSHWARLVRRVTATQVPPRRGTQCTSPPWWRAIWRTSAGPRPTPPSLRSRRPVGREKGSKRRSRSGAGTRPCLGEEGEPVDRCWTLQALACVEAAGPQEFAGQRVQGRDSLGEARGSGVRPAAASAMAPTSRWAAVAGTAPPAGPGVRLSRQAGTARGAARQQTAGHHTGQDPAARPGRRVPRLVS
jgi:hypothetical protein